MDDPTGQSHGALGRAERERERALQLGYHAVGSRERTVAELRTILERKRVEPEAIEGAVAELIAAGLLDDRRYANRFAEDKRDLERWGSGRIARELQRRGVPPRPDRGGRRRPQPRGRAGDGAARARAARRPSAGRPRARSRLAAAGAARLRGGAGVRGGAQARAQRGRRAAGRVMRVSRGCERAGPRLPSCEAVATAVVGQNTSKSPFLMRMMNTPERCGGSARDGSIESSSARPARARASLQGVVLVSRGAERNRSEN